MATWTEWTELETVEPSYSVGFLRFEVSYGFRFLNARFLDCMLGF